MATRSSILAWRIPRTEETGGLLSMGKQRVSHVRVTKLCTVFPWWLGWERIHCNVRDPDLIPGWGRSPGEGNGSPFQYSCLENSMDRGVWHAKNWSRQSDSHTHTHACFPEKQGRTPKMGHTVNCDYYT